MKHDPPDKEWIAEQVATNVVAQNPCEANTSWPHGLAEITGDWYWEIDSTGVFTASSRETLGSNLCDAHRIIGVSVREVFTHCFDDTKVTILETHFENRLGFRDVVLDAQPSVGDRVSLSFSGQPIFDDNKHFLGFRGVGRDITQEVTKNKAFQVLNEDLVGLSGDAFLDGALNALVTLLGADSAHVGVLSEDSADQVETITAFESGDKIKNFIYPLRGSPCGKTIKSSGVAIHQPEVSTLFPEDTTPTAMRMEAYVGCPLINADGSPFGVIALRRRTVFPYPDATATILSAFARRIGTECEQYSDASTRHRLYQFLDHFFQDMPLAIYLKRLDGHYEVVNEQFATMTGKTRDEIIGATVWDLGDPTTALAAEAHDREVIAAGTVSKCDLTFSSPRGGPVTVSCTKFPITDADGRTIGLGGFVLDISKNRQTEELLRAVFANIPLMLSLKDLEGRYLLVNKHHERRVGIQERDIVGKHTHEIHGKRHAAITLEMEQQARTRKTLVRREVDFFDAEGNLEYCWDVTKFPVFDQLGTVISIGSATLDVTKRRRAELSLQRQAAQLRAIFDASPAAIFLKDLSGRYLMVNDTFAIRVGISPEAVIGKTLFEITARDIAESALAEDQKVLETKAAIRADRSFQPPDGDEIWISTVKAPIFDARDAIIGICGVSVDITELKRYEWQLAEHKYNLERLVAERTREIDEIKTKIQIEAEGLRKLLDSSSVGIAIICKETRKRVYVNNELTKMLAAENAQELLAGEIQDTWVDPKAHAAAQLAFQEDDRYVGETHRRRLDGREAWFILKSEACTFEGRPSRIVWHVDITERKHMERDLLAAKEVSEARAQLLLTTQQQLLDKERFATLGQLTGTVSHELHNPLATIRNSIASLRKRVSDENSPLMPPLLRADRNIDRCVGIIEQLLSYAKSNDLNRTHIDFTRWLEDIGAEYEAPESIRIVVRSEVEGMIRFDGEKMRQAIVNLIDNAVHATNEHPDASAPFEIIIRAWLSGGRVEVRIADSGTGISDDALENLFQPLYSTKNFGFGLGLPLVRRILLQHGGDIDVESSSEAGTVLRLWLPVGDVAETCPPFAISGKE